MKHLMLEYLLSVVIEQQKMIIQYEQDKQDFAELLDRITGVGHVPDFYFFVGEEDNE